MCRIIIFLSIILIFNTIISGQDIIKEDELNNKGSEIIERAKKAVGIDIKSLKINSFQFSFNSLSVFEDLEIKKSTDIFYMSEGKFKYVENTSNLSDYKITTILNDGKFKKWSESEYAGRRTIRDLSTPTPPSPVMVNIAKQQLSPEELKIWMEEFSKRDPKQDLYNDFWVNVFPVFFITPIKDEFNYKFVGTAESGSTIAEIVDIEINDKRQRRLFFDSKTGYLLMMSVSYAGFDGKYESKYYFSERKNIDNILIPSKIKLEHTFTPTNETPRVTYTYIDFMQFKLNPQFKENEFKNN